MYFNFEIVNIKNEISHLAGNTTLFHPNMNDNGVAANSEKISLWIEYNKLFCSI